MLNNKKVQIMSKIALYEHGEGKETLKLNKYLKDDYTSVKLLSSLPLGILTALLITALAFCLDTDWPLKLYSSIGGTLAVIIYVGAFVVFVVLYCFFSAYMFKLKYDRHRGNLRRYGLDLKRLETIYSEEQNEQTDKFSK
ncbi:MAG: hypothetical protein IKI32_07500 [Lachnospiraceae bacterium]|jgi:hypothetical protein|nr:hypothetical protein [Lachnospiraceae bacterium]MBR3360754.1 hypothetical protein [Lachnospiraceae bacterium]MBR6357573.1 hypothetical protein [Lachnospiraceae bacterium]MBR7076754.1 hypothetical protein [Lachnospiraceae bacterium]